MSQDKQEKTATLQLRDKTYTVPAGLRIREAIRRIGLTPESYLAVRDGELVPDDERLRAGEVIRLIAVISGG
ncbi:MAG: MoaD/ThiS family protein [Chloroflexi bacterium]|nr:MoaD/ThiS family protein [Chloroflexota bacterium]